MKVLFLSGILLLFCCFNYSVQAQKNKNQQFSKELTELMDFFHIPGMAALVEQDGKIVLEEYMGFSDLKDSIKVNKNTTFPIASLTKMFTGVLLMQLLEGDKISLETPINQYLKKRAFGDSILIKHVLTHTSQGKPGQFFYYSYRFGALTPVIEKASGNTFEEAVSSHIFSPLKMDSSWFLTDSLETSKHIREFAKPYVFDGTQQLGPIEYGLSSSAGIVSTARDLLKFSQALDKNSIISNSSKQLFFSTLKEHLPYGHGVFSQKMEGLRFIWGYGQYDAYSSLFLKVPETKTTLILLANNNLMSDPARLINGDVTNSLFAQSFLNNYIYGQKDREKPALKRKKLLSQALAASFMARFDTEKWKESQTLLDTVFASYPNYLSYANLNVLHNLTFLKTVAFHLELGPLTKYDDKIEKIGAVLLEKDPNNPYANVYLGEYYDGKGDSVKARIHFENIVNAKNFSPFWYTSVAKKWLKENP